MDNFFDIDINMYFHINKLDIVKALKCLLFSIDKNMFILTNEKYRMTFHLNESCKLFCEVLVMDNFERYNIKHTAMFCNKDSVFIIHLQYIIYYENVPSNF